MKKFLAFVACGLITFSFSGCSGNSNTATIPTGKDAVEKADGKGKMGKEATSDIEASGMGANVTEPAI